MVDVGNEAAMIADKVKQVEQEKTLVDMQLEYYRNTKKYLDDPARIKKMVSPSVVGIEDPVAGCNHRQTGRSVPKKGSPLIQCERKQPGPDDH